MCPPLGAASDPSPPLPTSLLFLSSLSMTSVKRTSLPESFPSTRVERRASRRPATWSVSTVAAGRRAGLLLVRPSDRQAGRLVSDRKRSQLVVGPHLVQSPQQIPPTPPHVEPNSRPASGAAAPTPLLSVCRWRSVTLFPLVVFSCSLGCADVRTTVTTRCPNTTVSSASP